MKRVSAASGECMPSLIPVAFLVAALLSVSSSAFAQGARPIPQPTPQLTPQPTPQPPPQPTPQATPQPTPQGTPQPTPSPTPSMASSSQSTTPPEYQTAWPEPGPRYHPCPASVGLPNGRVVCLGWDDERRRPRTRPLVRRVASWGWGCRCCW
jgi:hypothetical protein